MGVELTTLSNGLRIITHAMPEFETTSLGVWVNAGGRHEARDQNGISHFIEHMAFKGTSSRSAKDIAISIEAVGGDLNAATSKEITAYYARVLRNDVELGIEILGDIVLNPVIDLEEFERERNVILQEIYATNDCPDDIIYDLVQEIAYPDQPIGRAILGSEALINSYQPSDLTRYMAMHYSSDRMVVCAVGAVDHDMFVRECEKIFGGMAALAPQNTAPACYAGGQKFLKSTFEQSHLMVAFEGPDYHDANYYDALVLSGLLGGGMSSRLFQEARERRGLCYSIYSFASGFSDSGLFGIHAASSGDKIGELRDVINGEMEDIANGGVRLQEIDMAKAQLKAGLLMGLESSMSRAEHLVRQIFAFGGVQTTGELIDKVDKVSLDGVREICSGFLNGGRPTLVVVGSEDALNLSSGQGRDLDTALNEVA